MIMLEIVLSSIEWLVGNILNSLLWFPPAQDFDLVFEYFSAKHLLVETVEAEVRGLHDASLRHLLPFSFFPPPPLFSFSVPIFTPPRSSSYSSPSLQCRTHSASSPLVSLQMRQWKDLRNLLAADASMVLVYIPDVSHFLTPKPLESLLAARPSVSR